MKQQFVFLFLLDYIRDLNPLISEHGKICLSFIVLSTSRK